MFSWDRRARRPEQRSLIRSEGAFFTSRSLILTKQQKKKKNPLVPPGDVPAFCLIWKKLDDFIALCLFWGGGGTEGGVGCSEVKGEAGGLSVLRL